MNDTAQEHSTPRGTTKRRRGWIIRACVGITILALGVLAVTTVRSLLTNQKAAENLSGIANAIKVYAGDNHGLYPPSIQALHACELVSRQGMLNPGSEHSPPACDFYYVVGLTEEDPSDWITAFGDMRHHGDRGTVVARNDGCVMYLHKEEFTEELEWFKAAYEEARGEPTTVVPPTAGP